MAVRDPRVEPRMTGSGESSPTRAGISVNDGNVMERIPGGEMLTVVYRYPKLICVNDWRLAMPDIGFSLPGDDCLGLSDGS